MDLKSITQPDYVAQLQALLPRGMAWNREPASVLTQLMEACGDDLYLFHQHMLTWLDETNPIKTQEMLPEWERDFGLPDACITETQTVAQRKAALISKMTMQGGQSAAYFEALAASIGFEVTIDELAPFRAGAASAGDALTNDDWLYVWRVNAPEVTKTPFAAGLSAAGEPLYSWSNETLECLLNHYKPAHTIVQYAYH